MAEDEEGAGKEEEETVRRSVDYLKCLCFFVFLFRFIYFYFMGTSIHLHGFPGTLCMQFPQRPEGGVLDSLEPRVTDTCEQPCRCTEPKLGPLPSLQAYGEN